MEELFEGLFALIVVVIGLAAKFAGQTKKVKQNAPGKAAAPVRPAAPAAERMRSSQSIRPVPAQPTVKPTIHPAGSAGVPDFWKQIGEELKEEQASEKSAAAQPAKGHEAAGKMAEGDSRECEHGSVGGSMAYEGHQEGREEKPVMPPRPAATAAPAYRPAMTAQEMRRAVVMAEVLKRPQERMAEQARRWSVR